MKVSQHDQDLTIEIGTGEEQILLVINPYRAVLMQQDQMILLSPEMYAELNKAINYRPNLIQNSNG